MKSDEKLHDELKEAVEGLTFMSEADYPLEVVRWDATEAPTHERLRRQARLTVEAPVEEVSVDHFFRVAAGEQAWKGAAQIATARRFQRLVRLLKENLADLKVYRLGEIKIQVYVVGRGSEGDWLGVATRVVET
jgi:hypothetical protein